MARNTTPTGSGLDGGEQAEGLPQVEVIGAVAPTEPEPAPEVPKMADLKGVRYIGNADVKIFEVSDLESVGVPATEPLTWRGPGSFVEAKDLTAAARDFLATQPDFVVE